jgi:hypothetical protein
LNRETLKAVLEIVHGYEHVREIDGLGFVGLSRFIFTVGVLWGLDESGYKGRFCFDTHMDAELFLREWDGTTYPVVGEDGCTAIKGVL